MCKNSKFFRKYTCEGNEILWTGQSNTKLFHTVTKHNAYDRYLLSFLKASNTLSGKQYGMVIIVLSEKRDGLRIYNEMTDS